MLLLTPFADKFEKKFVRKPLNLPTILLRKILVGFQWEPKKLLEAKLSIISTRAEYANLKVHKIENFFDSDFGICIISLLVMHK